MMTKTTEGRQKPSTQFRVVAEGALRPHERVEDRAQERARAPRLSSTQRAASLIDSAHRARTGSLVRRTPSLSRSR